MYKFYYEYVKNKLDPKLLFTNTDSLVYEIKGEDVYEVPYSERHLFDFTKSIMIQLMEVSLVK